MQQDEFKSALYQSKTYFVHQTQIYILSVTSMHIVLALLWGHIEGKPAFEILHSLLEIVLLVLVLFKGYTENIPEFLIIYILVELSLLSYVVYRLGSRININFALIVLLLLVMVLPFSFLALTPLKRFQKDREYIDYRRRQNLLPNLSHAVIENMKLEGRFPLIAWCGVILGPMSAAYGYASQNNLVVVLGLVLFTIGLWTFNRTIITIRGEKITISRNGLGGSLRRSNFTVIHRIEVTHIDQMARRLKIRYQFVGSGVEREVIFMGSKKSCDDIVNALTSNTNENVYDIEAMALDIDTTLGIIETDQSQVADITGDSGEAASSASGSRIGVRTLISAIRSNQLGLINQLLAVGVDVNAHDASGITPLRVAEQNGNEQVVYLLKRAGASR